MFVPSLPLDDSNKTILWPIGFPAILIMQNKWLKSIAGGSQQGKMLEDWIQTSILTQSFLDINHHYSHSYGKSSGHTSFRDTRLQTLKAISGQSNYISLDRGDTLWNWSYDSTHARCHMGILLIPFYQLFCQLTKKLQIWIYLKLKWLQCESAINSFP